MHLGTIRIRTCALFFLLAQLPALAGPGPDGIELSVSRDPSGGVLLEWTGGQPTFEVFRSPNPGTVTDPLNKLGDTDVRSWTDVPPAGSLFAYLITSPCVVNPPEVCDGVDNDCDGAVDEDYVPTPTSCGVGVCAGNSGSLECVNGSEVDTCDPFLGATTESCDGLDNDCDGVQDDGDPGGGSSCDTGQPGICAPGTTECQFGTVVCTANQTPSAEVCDGLDNDCDGVQDNGDPGGGQSCNTGQPGICAAGTTSCQGGALVCAQDQQPTAEVCDGLDNDCDGTPDDGLVANDNPLCTSGTFYLGTLSGDTGAGLLTDSFWNEEWDRFTLREDSSSVLYLGATITLYSPPGVDYDLYVYCASCGGALADLSTVRSTSGHFDTVQVRADDQFGIDDTFDVIVEIRHVSSGVCAYWSLEVAGNSTVPAATCN